MMRKKSSLLMLCSLIVGIAMAGISEWKQISITDLAGNKAVKSAKVVNKISRANSESRPVGAFCQSNKVTQYSEAEGVDIYGFSCNDEDYKLNGLVKFNSNSPSEMSRDNIVEDDVTAGAYAADAYYVMRTFQYFYPGALCTVDLTTGQLTEVASYVENPDVRQATEMSYDVTTDTMYMLFASDDDPYCTAFGTVDLKTGEQKVINANMNRYVRAMAVDKEGTVYGIDQDGMLLVIDKRTGVCNNVKQLNVMPFWRQTMEFNRSTGELYWAYRDSYSYSTLKKVDIKSGVITDLGVIGDGMECVVGLYIPYSLYEAGAPAKVENLTLTPAEMGELSATIEWTCPTLTFDGNTLSSIDNVKVYRNNNLIQTVTDAEPGKTISIVDTPAKSAVYTYKVVAENADGEGPGALITSFVGTDLPAAVKITAVKRQSSSEIALEWEAPAVGMNEGYFDSQSLSYKVTRISDNKVLAENLTATSFVDNTITELNRYRYEITVSNADGEGGTTSTGYIVNGPARDLPLNADFNNQKEADLWTIGDANGDGVHFFWQRNQYENRCYFYYQTEWEQDANDWLISPPTKFENGKVYKMVVTAKPSSPASPEIIEFYLVKNYDLSTAIKVGETFNVIGQLDANDEVVLTDYRAVIENVETGEYSVAVKCASTAWDGYWLAISGVEVSENTDGNLRGDVWDDSENPVEGVKVSLKDTEFYAMTDDKGQFEIEHVPAGDYTIVCSKLGYKDSSSDITVKLLGTTNLELDIVKRKEYGVTGVVNNEYGSPLKNTEIQISGYNTYLTSTDEQGVFSIEGVYEHEDNYTLTASKDFYQSVETPLAVSNADVNVDLTLNDDVLPPATASARIADDENSAVIEWSRQGYDAEVRKHSANGSYTFGTDEGDATTLIGVVCRQPVILESLEWTSYCDSPTVNIIVLALDDNGNATSQELFKEENADNEMYDKSKYEFPQPVYAPKGCFIGISIDNGNLSLLTAENTSDYPFVEEYNAYIESYTADTTLNFVENLGNDYRENFFISFKGTILAGDEAPATKFNIYRVDSDDNVTLLNSDKTEGLTFVDMQWSIIENGDYHYAVEAIYDNGEVTQKVLTNQLTQLNSSIDKLINSQKVIAVELYDTAGVKIATLKSLKDVVVAPGVYVARIKTEKGWIIKKLIIG